MNKTERYLKEIIRQLPDPAGDLQYNSEQDNNELDDREMFAISANFSGRRWQRIVAAAACILVCCVSVPVLTHTPFIAEHIKAFGISEKEEFVDTLNQQPGETEQEYSVKTLKEQGADSSRNSEEYEEYGEKHAGTVGKWLYAFWKCDMNIENLQLQEVKAWETDSESGAQYFYLYDDAQEEYHITFQEDEWSGLTYIEKEVLSEAVQADVDVAESLQDTEIFLSAREALESILSDEDRITQAWYLGKENNTDGTLAENQFAYLFKEESGGGWICNYYYGSPYPYRVRITSPDSYLESLERAGELAKEKYGITDWVIELDLETGLPY
ncbi:MAG: hypothetical protein J6K48_10655 [Lachnospiraceae bacterium]|nr:hypothetical protein [Lachnospiraceae bacterium]